MAEIIYKDPYVTINGVNLSSFVKQATIRYGAEILDKTAGATNAKKKIAGLTDWSLELEMNQDYDAGAVDATLFPLVGPGIDFPVVVKPNGAVTAVSNPQFSGTGILGNYNPLAGTVGQPVTTPVTIEGSGDLARATV